MKELRIPKAISIRYHFNGENPKSSSSGNEFSAELSIIERNGAEIISAAVLLEERMIEAVSKILFGKGQRNEKSREFFVDEIIGTSDFSYASKRRVFTRMLEQMEILDAEEVKKLRSGLNKVMVWRNAFAHGRVFYEKNGGFILQYYSGGYQEVVLDDAFFENVESTFRDCLYQCNGIIQSQ
jgi:hypothetical protein